METLVKILHVIVCIFLMLTVLLQAGKGGGMGAAFGGGSSMGTVFGGSGAGNFLRRLTVGAAVIFMITSMTLAWMATPSTDPLEKYWAQQRKAEMDREKAHEQAIDKNAPAAGAGDKAAPADGEGVGPDEMTGDEVDTGEAIDTGEGAAGDDAIETPTEGAASEAVETPPAKPQAGKGSVKKPPAATPQPKSPPPPPPAAPVAPPPGSSSPTTTTP